MKESNFKQRTLKCNKGELWLLFTRKGFIRARPELASLQKIYEWPQGVMSQIFDSIFILGKKEKEEKEEIFPVVITFPTVSFVMKSQRLRQETNWVEKKLEHPGTKTLKLQRL